MNEATATVVPAPQEIKLTERNIRNFWKKVNKDGPTMPHMESPCWLWTAGRLRKGYGQFQVADKGRKAHRIAWLITNGQIPDGLCACHRCDVPACVNPSHLFLGTHADNAADRDAKGRNNQPKGATHFARLNPERMARGDKNGNSKLTDSIVATILTSHASGVTQRLLAAQCGVSRSLLSAIIKRKIWRHVKVGLLSDT
jgi:hypothetical protein